MHAIPDLTLALFTILLGDIQIWFDTTETKTRLAIDINNCNYYYGAQTRVITNTPLGPKKILACVFLEEQNFPTCLENDKSTNTLGVLKNGTKKNYTEEFTAKQTTKHSGSATTVQCIEKISKETIIEQTICKCEQ